MLQVGLVLLSCVFSPLSPSHEPSVGQKRFLASFAGCVSWSISESDFSPLLESFGCQISSTIIIIKKQKKVSQMG